MKAFPCTNAVDEFNGMDLRDYFAAKAMQGFLTTPQPHQYNHLIVVEDSYKVADAMMKAREQ